MTQFKRTRSLGKPIDQPTIATEKQHIADKPLTVLFNIVDPFLVFVSLRIEGFNDINVDINEYVRSSKAFQPLQRDYDTLIVGNS